MQKLFAMFPGGGPGIALLLLRLSVSLQILIGTGGLWLEAQGQLVYAAVSLLALAVVLGILTPIAASLCGLLQILGLFLPGTLLSFSAVLPLLNAVALGLLGPGAYSIDARIFGRRVVVLTDDANERRRR